MNNVLRSILIVIAMGISKWFVALAFLYILSFISLFIIEAIKEFLIPMFAVIIASGLGILYAYLTKFLGNVNLKLKYLIGFLLLGIGVFQIYTQYLHYLEIRRIFGAVRNWEGISFPELLFDFRIILVLVLYALTFIVAFSFYLWKNRSKTGEFTRVH